MKQKLLFIFTLLIVIASAAGASTASYDVVVARGDIPVDLIVAQVYTQKENIPLVTVTGDGISEELQTELMSYEAQGYGQALIIGGEDAVPQDIENKLHELNFEVTRMWDWDRYGTSARVAIDLWEKSNTVVVAQVDEEGRLISAARIALGHESPLLLTKKIELPAQTKQAVQELEARRIILVGEVSGGVKAELAMFGTVEESEILPYVVIEPTGKGLFVIGLVVGALFIFVVSIFWGKGFIRKQAEVPYGVLNEDEQKIVDIINENQGKLRQDKLPRLTDFSRPKVSRLVSDLMGRNIVSREKQGKTYVLKLEKKVKKS